jgi:hypothetical protein
VKASAITKGSMIRTLLEDARLCLDLDGAEGEVEDMATDFGVIGVDCEAMAEILGNLKLGSGKEV